MYGLFLNLLNDLLSNLRRELTLNRMNIMCITRQLMFATFQGEDGELG